MKYTWKEAKSFALATIALGLMAACAPKVEEQQPPPKVDPFETLRAWKVL